MLKKWFAQWQDTKMWYPGRRKSPSSLFWNWRCERSRFGDLIGICHFWVSVVHMWAISAGFVHPGSPLKFAPNLFHTLAPLTHFFPWTRHRSSDSENGISSWSAARRFVVLLSAVASRLWGGGGQRGYHSCAFHSLLFPWNSTVTSGSWSLPGW